MKPRIEGGCRVGEKTGLIAHAPGMCEALAQD